MYTSEQAKANNKDEHFTVREGRIGRWGLIFLDDIDSEEFRALKGAAVRVYLTLLPFVAKESGECYPRQSTIARIAGISRQTANSAIAELCTGGLLAKRVEVDPNGKADRVIYTLLRVPSRRPKYESI